MKFNILFKMVMEDIENQTSTTQNQDAADPQSLMKQAAILRDEAAKTLMKQAAILRAEAETLNYGASMDNSRTVFSQSKQAIDAVNQKIKKAEELEAKAKTINPNIQQTYSLNVPKENLPTEKLNKNF